MKTNLKTRPTWDWLKNNLDKIEDVEIWFEKFEVELRQKLKESENALFHLGIELVVEKKEPYNDDTIQSLENQIASWWKIRYLLRELLGITENSSVSVVSICRDGEK